MEPLNAEKLKEIHLKVQEKLYNKATKAEVDSYLKEKVSYQSKAEFEF